MENRGILYTDHEHCIAVHGSAVIAFSLQPPNPKCLEAWTTALVQLTQRTQGPISILIIIDSGARSPDEATKRQIQDVCTRYAGRIGAFAYVIEGEGFGAAALRSAISLMSLAARYPYPQKVFKRVSDATAWILPRMSAKLPDDVTVVSTLATVELMRRQVKPLAAAI
jgi:hypothetical protein